MTDCAISLIHTDLFFDIPQSSKLSKVERDISVGLMYFPLPIF